MNIALQNINFSDTSTKFGLATFAGIGLIGGWYLWWRRRWILVGEVSEIFVYPLKAGVPLQVNSVSCSERAPSWDGKVRDRDFMVVTEEMEAVTSSLGYHKIVVIKLTLIEGEEDQWKIEAPGMDVCLFDDPCKSGEETTVKLWDVQVTGFDCGDEVAQWISTFLGKKVRLIKHAKGDSTSRIARPKWRKLYPSTMVPDTIPAYADVSPYMLTTAPSLVDLNRRFPSGFQVDQRTFRPNFVIDGENLSAWDEDVWIGEVKIGEVVLRYNKPCNRCNSTRVDPDKGELYPDSQPLKTLRTFRQHDSAMKYVRRVVGDSPIFGMHYQAVKGGNVNVGDKVWVRYCGTIKEETELIRKIKKK